jgi:VanZ family protein
MASGDHDQTTTDEAAHPASRRAARSSESPASPGRRRRLFWAWMMVLFWAGVIWMLGGDDFSFAETTRTFSPWFEWLFGELDSATKWRLMIALRKSAHFVEYGILALLTFRAALLSAPRTQLLTATFVTLFLVATLATADEARQAFLVTRTGSPVDILIDVTGGLIAIAGLITIRRRMRPSEGPQPA